MRVLRGIGAGCLIVLSIVTLLMWGRSCFVVDALRYGTDVNYGQMMSAAGSIVYSRANPTREGESDSPMGWRYQRHSKPQIALRNAQFADTVWNRLGFAVTDQNVVAPKHLAIHNIAIPHWFILLFSVPLALRWLARQDVEEDQDLMECPRCGQIFTSLPQDCPVCGHRLKEIAAQGAPDA